MEHFVQVQYENGIGILLVTLGIVEKYLLRRHDHVLFPPAVAPNILLGRN